MSEHDYRIFLDKYTSKNFQAYMVVLNKFSIAKPKNLKKNEFQYLSAKNTFKVGKVLLSLHNSNAIKYDGLVELNSTKENLEAIALAIRSNSPVLVEGVVGSGKTCLIEHIANMTGRSKSPELSKIQLSDQTDSKTLIGTYRCTPNPGEFIWQAGSLTQAVTEGHWLLLEDIDFAPIEVISLLIPILESRLLSVPGHGNIRAHPNFQIFATRRILPAGCRMRIGSTKLIENLFTKVTLKNLSSVEIKSLISTKWPDLSIIAEKLVEVYIALSYGQHSGQKSFEGCPQCGSKDLTSAKASGRFVSLRDLMKWCLRMMSHINVVDLHIRAFEEALDCFCAAVPDVEKRYKFALHIGSHLNLNEPTVHFYFHKYKPEVSGNSLTTFSIGSRGKIPRKRSSLSLKGVFKSMFSKTRLSSCLLEKLTVAVMNNEPVLIVGETGTGKTSTVQYLSQQTNHSIKVINMNQQSDSTDLLGGFKPVEMRTVVSPLRQEFEILFSKTFSVKENTVFLSHIMTSFVNQNWKVLFSLMGETSKKGCQKLNGEIGNNTYNGELRKQWQNFLFKMKSIKDQANKLQSALAFSFIEGTLVKAVLEGEWVLLDEINLASPDTLECLSGLLESTTGSVTLHERGDTVPLFRHPEFRLFACMNPATDVGKKELPAGLRNRFTEFFMEEYQEKEDLIQLVQEYLQEHNPSPKLVSGIVIFYLKVREVALTQLTDGTGHKPHFSLRTLCRALVVAKRNPCKIFSRSLEEAFCLSFLTQLDRSSYPIVTALIEEKILFKKLNVSKKLKNNSSGFIPCPGHSDDYVHVEGYWVRKGDLEPKNPEKYIVTLSVQNNLKDLVRIVSIGRFPILLQGDTSVGKTSLISYLAQLTGYTCFRINNHQHTDLQEYVGSYVPDESGKLVFKEGVLVQAMRNGHWIILDELNLAPTDVLEALNRLLDDNRELFIPEIETTVKAHPQFMLFATQNPPGLYGGRQMLSRAFRNRFVELHFDMIPSKELAVILHRRCDISLSHSEKMIRVLEDLQKMRRDSNIFQGKQSFITLRDLFRWAERYRLAHDPASNFYDWDQHIADEGYLVLAGRMRLEKEAEEIKKVLEKNMKRKVNPKHLFELSSETSPVTRPILEKLSLVKDFKHIVWTLDMRRLFVLVSKSLSFCEPVLLVGETGCGKTTVCQMIAAIKEQNLFTVNCHMHTEGADFLGGLRPVRDRASANDNRLFEWVDGPLIQAMKSGGLFLADEISLADDSVLERLNSLLEPERTLVLTEKGCTSEGDKLKKPDFVVAHDLFRLIGTMNPGGDYGKKELSPALRNRLTEIWCPKVEIDRSKDDVLLIIDHNLHSFSLKLNEYSISKAMLSFLLYFSKTDLGKKCTISIRDILSWVSFINKVTTVNPDLDVGLAYVHGASLVFLDSLGSGATGSTVLNWKFMKESFQRYLCKQASKLTSNYPGIATLSENYASSLSVINNSQFFGIEPFVITKGPILQTDLFQFSFKTPKTCLNLLRILRGLQLSRPILLEGSPGVGKTSIVTALAKASGNEIIRINLSEQTDVSDLFGADLPEEGSEGGRFAWRDGPLLQALKAGAWVVLDELNLASQSVLEGLNACFDHRGEVFVPELNKTFEVKHNFTKIFACQNPQYQGGARKGLPKSFLNRFTQVYIEPFTSEDLTFILRAIHSEIPLEVITKMINFNETLVREVHEEKLWGNAGGPWEFNLRDLFRWCEIMLKSKSFETRGILNPGEFVEVIYADRMRKNEDKENVLTIYKRIFGEDFSLYQKSGIFFINESFIQVGQSFIDKGSDGNYANHRMNAELFIMHNQAPYLESIINCINMNWMTILVGDSGEGKTSLVYLLSNLTGRRLETIAVNSHMDVTELLGGFEQADYGRHLSELMDNLDYDICKVVRRHLLDQNSTNNSDILKSWKEVIDMKKPNKNLTTSEEVEYYLKVCYKISEAIDCLMKRCPTLDVVDLKKSCQELIMKVSSTKTVSGGGIFEWVDSSLVKAVRNGYWLLIDGVNLCSPSVLDRLNGLLEPGGVLTINERGIIDGKVPTVKPHPDFRIFLTMDPQYGEISRAMRNRGLEICMTNMWEDETDACALLLAQGLKNVIHQKLLIKAHSCVRDALPGYEKLSISYLCRAASQMNQLMQLGQSPFNALQQSLNLTYGRNFVKVYRATVKETIKIFVAEIDKIILKNSHPCPPLDRLFLGASIMHNASDAAYPCQVVSLIESFEMSCNLKISPEVLSSLPLPLSLPSSSHSLLTALFVILASASLPHWELLLVWATDVAPKHSMVSKVIKRICKSPSNPLMRLKDITNFQLPADPRYNIQLVIINGLDLNEISYLANKALVSLWFNIRKEFKLQHVLKNKKKSNKKSKSKLSIFELSKEICTGTVSSKMCYHSSLNYIYPLINSLSKLITTLTNDFVMPFSDIDYFDFQQALLWVDRFENICQQVAQKETFHLFLPHLVFHWQKLQDTLFNSIPPIWQNVLPKELVNVNDQLKHDFYSYCSPLHHIVPIFRTHLGGPLPFANEITANFYVELARVASSLVPYHDKVDDCSINYLLASEAGLRAKCALVDVVVDSGKEDVDFFALLSQLHNIDETIKLEQSKDKLNLDKTLSAIQVWPIVDLLVSKQLNFTEAKRTSPKVFVNECTEALIKCSRLPLDCINANDPSGRLSAVSVYLFNVNNCSVKRPSRWVFYEESQEDAESSKACDYWKGEDKVILSSFGCLLTYHLLTGFCKPNQEMEEITVGRHCERDQQLTNIRATLFRNWNHFTDMDSSYDFSFSESVKKFVCNLFSALSITMRTYVDKLSSTDYLELLKIAEIVFEKQQQILGTEGCKLLSLLTKQRQVLEVSNENDIELTKLGIYAGLFQSWLLSHVEPLDPAQQRNLMLSYHAKESEVLEDTLLIYKWVELLRYNYSEQLSHPHASFYADKLEKIKSELKSLSRIIAYRPEPSQYVELSQKITDFNNTVFLPSRILEIVTCVESFSGNNLATILQQCEGMLLSCDNFIKNIFTSYLPYKDLYIPLLHGVSFTCESIRVMMAQRKLQDLCSSSKSNLTPSVTRVLSVPLMRNNDDPSLTVTKIIEDQTLIASVLKKYAQNKNHCILSQSLLLRCSIYDLYNFAVAETCLEKTVFNHLSSLTAKVIEWWKAQKEEEKRKAEEEASLFKYKARTLAISETEEEEIEREYKEIFPDYDEEFNDLDNIILDDNMNVEENSKEVTEDKDVPKLTDNHLQELIECYLLLSTSLINTNWLAPSMDLEMKIVTPVLLRSQQVQLLLRAVGPIMSQDIDGASIGSFLISNHIASSTIKETINLSLINKPYNYYHDSVPEESLKIKPLLQNLEMKVNELLVTWPSHPTLLMINKVIHRVLNFSVTSPLIRFVIGLEAVLERSHEWEKNAHKGVSLMAVVSPITDQILEWRKKELNAWKSCLDMITFKVSIGAHIYWPHLYESFATIDLDNVSELIESLKQFMEKALIGDYERRLQLMFSFHCHLINSSKYCQNPDKKCVFDKLKCVIWNIFKYYEQFLSFVKETIAKEIKPIEKQVKDFIKIMRWNDINFFAVKDSVIKSRRTLHRHMRNWEKILRQSSEPLLIDIKAGSDLESGGEWDSKENTKAIKPFKVVFSVDVEVCSVPGVPKNTLISRLPSLTLKCSTFVSEILQNVSYSSNVEAIEEMTSQVIATYQNLSLETAKAEAISDKDNRMRQLKAIMHHKRECLSTLLKSLTHIGVSYTKGNSIYKEDDRDKCLLVPPIDIRISHGNNKNLENICCLWETCDKYYYRCIGRHSVVFNALNKEVHADLGPELIKRLKGTSCHLLLFARTLREALPSINIYTSEAILMVNEIKGASKMMFQDINYISQCWSKINSLVISLTLTLAEEKKLLETFTDSEPLVIIKPSKISLSALQVQDILVIVSETYLELRKIVATVSINNQNFNKERSFKLASEENILELKNIIEKLSSVSQNIERILTLLDATSHPTSTLSEPLSLWIKSWEFIESEFEDWSLELRPVSETCYSSSEMVETCITKILLGVEGLYKSYCNVQNTDEKDNDDTKLMISDGIVKSLCNDLDKLKFADINDSIFTLISELRENHTPSMIIAVKEMLPLLSQYITICENLLAFAVSSSRSINKLLSIILAIYQQMTLKGLCRPSELEEQTDGEGATTFEDSGPGLTEGEGQKDVSDRFESEDQLESALQEGQKEQTGDKDVAEEEGGIEMSQDFEGKMQNIEKMEDEDKKDNDDDDGSDDDELDKEMGETEKGADKIDEKLWGEEEDEKDDDDGPEKEEEDEHGPGDGETTESELVAKDDNKSKKDVDNREEKKKKELEVMEEDLREQNEENDEETYDDKYRDNLGGEDNTENNEEEEQMELPDTLNLDGKEKNEGSEDEDDPDINPEIEEKALFPEEGRESKEKEDEQENNSEEGQEEGVEGEDIPEEEGPNDGEEIKEEKDRVDKTRLETEKGEDEEDITDNAIDEATTSQDSEAKEEAQSAETNTKDASKDKTKDLPKTDTGAQPEEDEEFKQDEQGEMGEQTEDMAGVGQSDSKTREDSHKGQTSALTNEQQAEQKRDEETRPRKPGEIDNTKTLGDVEKEIHQGLMTKKSSNAKEEKEERSDSAKSEDKDPEGKDAQMYEHIGMADDHYDKQTIDAGTQEEAKLRPAPLEEGEEENKDEPEGIEDTLMDVDEVVEEIPVEETKKRQADGDGKDGPMEKKSREDTDGFEKANNQLETEGEIIKEMIVERPPQNEYHTLSDDDDIGAETFNEDLAAAVRESIMEADDGDFATGADQWVGLEGKITPLALQLCEQLRLILEPTEASKLRGDFRTGKRLNMRKVIPYIASQFRKDKIWLRRTQPSKRSYQVLLAVDDSESMKEMNAGELTRESVSLVAKALTLLEVGNVGVLSFGKDTKILHPLHMPFSDLAGAKIFGNLKFDQTETNFAKMIRESVALFGEAKEFKGVRPEVSQLLLIVSDGQTHKHLKAVKAAVRAAREARVFLVFLVIDALKENSFYDTQVCEFIDDKVKLTSLSESFPFPYFLVVRDLQGLPDVLAAALRQWFELVTADAH